MFRNLRWALVPAAVAGGLIASSSAARSAPVSDSGLPSLLAQVRSTGTFNWTWIIWGVLIVLAVWVLVGLFRALSRGGQGQSYSDQRPMAGPGAGSGGGGFMGNFLGGMFGAAAGSWVYDSFFRGGSQGPGWGGPSMQSGPMRSPGLTASPPAPPSRPAPAPGFPAEADSQKKAYAGDKLSDDKEWGSPKKYQGKDYGAEDKADVFGAKKGGGKKGDDDDDDKGGGKEDYDDKGGGKEDYDDKGGGKEDYADKGGGKEDYADKGSEKDDDADDDDGGKGYAKEQVTASKSSAPADFDDMAAKEQAAESNYETDANAGVQEPAAESNYETDASAGSQEAPAAGEVYSGGPEQEPGSSEEREY